MEQATRDTIVEELFELMCAKGPAPTSVASCPTLVAEVAAKLSDPMFSAADTAWVLIRTAVHQPDEELLDNRPLLAAKHLLALGKYPQDVLADTAKSLEAIAGHGNRKRSQDLRTHSDIRREVAVLAGRYGNATEGRALTRTKGGGKNLRDVANAMVRVVEELLEPERLSALAVQNLQPTSTTTVHSNTAAQEAADQFLWHLEELGIVVLAYHLAVSETSFEGTNAQTVQARVRSRDGLLERTIYEYAAADFFGIELVRTVEGKTLLSELEIPRHLETLGSFALSEEERSFARLAIGADIHLEPRSLRLLLGTERSTLGVVSNWLDALTLTPSFVGLPDQNDPGSFAPWSRALGAQDLRKAFLLNLSDLILGLRQNGLQSAHTKGWMQRRLHDAYFELLGASSPLRAEVGEWAPRLSEALHEGTHNITVDINWVDRWQTFRTAYDETQRTFWDELISPDYRARALRTRQWLRDYNERYAWDPKFRIEVKENARQWDHDYAFRHAWDGDEPELPEESPRLLD